MKKLFAVALISSLGVAAFADTNTLAFRLGLVRPTDGGVPFDEFTSFGIQYKLADFKSEGRFANSGEISVDFYGRGDFRSVPVLYNFVGTSKTNGYFYSVGAGVSFIKRPDGAGTESIGRFAYQLGAGYNLTTGENASFFEVKYFGSGASNLNAFGVFLGVRF